MQTSSTRRSRIEAQRDSSPEQVQAQLAAQVEAREQQDEIEPDVLAAVAFAGNALAPFFLYDPEKGRQVAYEAMAALDVDAAAEEWPFVDEAVAHEALGAMVADLAARAEALAAGEDDDLAWEYRRLFVGPLKKAAPLWGSVYTDYESVIFGESTLALRRWVRNNEVVEATDHSTPEDHIGLMLQQMAWIAENRPELLREYLRDHLLTWSSHFLDVVEGSTTMGFYRGLAQLTRATLEGIQEELDIEVVLPRYYR